MGNEYVRTNKYGIQQFFGIRDRARIGEGWWQDMNNMTADEYPVAKTRDKRTFINWNDGTTPAQATFPGKPISAASIDEQLYVATEDGYVINRDKAVKAPGVGRIAAFGRNLITDSGAYINGDMQTVETTMLHVFGKAEFTLTDQDSEEIQYATGEKPTNPTDGMYWFDAINNGLYQYSAAESEWVYVPVSYIKIKFVEDTGIEIPDISGYKPGDAVAMIGGGEDSAYIVEKVDAEAHVMTFPGLMDVTPAQGESVLTSLVDITRRCPRMDFIAQHNNRMWGCRYGDNDRGEFVNEIYASALGDPLNWFKFEGTSADSWTTSVGAPGVWTGLIEAGDHLFFFKENSIFVLSGTTPGTFRLTHIEDAGVQLGSDRSLVTIHGNVYYKSVTGVMRIGGEAHPGRISDDLGKDRWRDAIGGTDGTKYYLSMTDGTDRRLYVYDTEKRVWTVEDSPANIALMIKHRNMLVALNAPRTDEVFDINYWWDEAKAQAQKPQRKNYDTWYAYYAAYTVWLISAIVWRNQNGTLKALADIAGDSLEGQTATDVANWLVQQPETTTFISWIISYAYRAEYVILSGIPEPAALSGLAWTMTDWEISPSPLSAAGVAEPDFGWFVESGLLGLDFPNEQRLRVLQIRVNTEDTFRVKIRYDDAGEWNELRHENVGKKGTFRISFIPARRCDTFRMRLEGFGNAIIYSINMITEDAGDNVY